MTTSTPPDALPASKEAEAEPIGYLFELCYSHDHDRWSGTMYSSHLPNPSDVRNVQPLFAHPPTDAGVSDDMVKRFFAELRKRNAPMPFTEDAKSALRAALSTAIPAGDGVLAAEAKAHVVGLRQCSIFAEDVGPYIAKQMRESADFIEANMLSTASTAGKG